MTIWYDHMVLFIMSCTFNVIKDVLSAFELKLLIEDGKVEFISKCDIPWPYRTLFDRTFREWTGTYDIILNGHYIKMNARASSVQLISVQIKVT